SASGILPALSSQPFHGLVHGSKDFRGFGRDQLESRVRGDLAEPLGRIDPREVSESRLTHSGKPIVGNPFGSSYPDPRHPTVVVEDTGSALSDHQAQQLFAVALNLRLRLIADPIGVEPFLLRFPKDLDIALLVKELANW